MEATFHCYIYIYGLCFMVLCCDSGSTVKSSQVTNAVLSDTGAMNNKTMVLADSGHTDITEGENSMMEQTPVVTKSDLQTTKTAIISDDVVVPSATSKQISTPGFKVMTNSVTKSAIHAGGNMNPASNMTVNNKQSPAEFMSTESEKITTIKPTEQKIIIKNDTINTSAKLMGPQMFKGDNKSDNNVVKNDNLDSMEISTIVPETSISQDNVTMRLNKVESTTKMPYRTTQIEAESPSKAVDYTTQQRNLTVSPMITKLINTHINDATLKTLNKSGSETHGDISTKSTKDQHSSSTPPVLLPIIFNTTSSTVSHKGYSTVKYQGLPVVPVVSNDTNNQSLVTSTPSTSSQTMGSDQLKSKPTNKVHVTENATSKSLSRLLNLTITSRPPTELRNNLANASILSLTSISTSPSSGNFTTLHPVPIIRNETSQKILTTVPSNVSDINVSVQSEHKTTVIVTPSTTTKVPPGLQNVTTTIVKEATSLQNVTSGLQTHVPLGLQNVTTTIANESSLRNVTLQTQNVTQLPVLVTSVSVQTNASSVNLTSPTPMVVLSTNASHNMSGLMPIPVTISPSNITSPTSKSTSSSTLKPTSSTTLKPTPPSTLKPTMPSRLKPTSPSTLKPTLPPSSTSKSTSPSTAKPAKSTTEKPSITKSILPKTTMGPTITVIVDIPVTTDSNVTLTMAGLSTSALTAIITGSIIGFWVILGPLICLFCKLRDKRRDRRASNPGGYENVNKGIIDAMIMSELKRIAPDNPVRNKEVQYGTVAHDVEETTVLTNGHETNDHDRTSKIPITVL